MNFKVTENGGGVHDWEIETQGFASHFADAGLKVRINGVEVDPETVDPKTLGSTSPLRFDASSFEISRGHRLFDIPSPDRGADDSSVQQLRRLGKKSKTNASLAQTKILKEAMTAAHAGFDGVHLPLTVRKASGGFLVPSIVRSETMPESDLKPVSLEQRNPKLKNLWIVGHQVEIGEGVPLRMHDPKVGSVRFDAGRSQKLMAAFRDHGTKLIAVRHGQSEMNARDDQGRHTIYGRIDSPLTDLGKQQARDAAAQVYESLGGDAWLADAVQEPSKLPVIVASPLARAHQTGQALSNLLQSKIKGMPLTDAQKDVALSMVQVHSDPRIQEFGFGQLEGVQVSDMRQDYPAAFERFMRKGLPGAEYFHRFPNSTEWPSESRLQVFNRVNAFLQDVANRFKGRTIVTFAHQGPLSAMEASLHGKDKGYAKGPDGVMTDQSFAIKNGVPMKLVG